MTLELKCSYVARHVLIYDEINFSILIVLPFLAQLTGLEGFFSELNCGYGINSYCWDFISNLVSRG